MSSKQAMQVNSSILAGYLIPYNNNNDHDAFKTFIIIAMFVGADFKI